MIKGKNKAEKYAFQCSKEKQKRKIKVILIAEEINNTILVWRWNDWRPSWKIKWKEQNACGTNKNYNEASECKYIKKAFCLPDMRQQKLKLQGKKNFWDRTLRKCEQALHEENQKIWWEKSNNHNFSVSGKFYLVKVSIYFTLDLQIQCKTNPNTSQSFYGYQ